MNGYPGAKAGAGVRQQIISLMPPHETYVEPFFGSGQIFYAKKPAEYSIVADRDEGLIRMHARQARPRTAYLVADALELLPSLKLTRRDLVYLDPPYHPAARSRAKIYRYELDTRAHSRLLAMVDALPCNVILSGYNCAAYERALGDWYRLDYGTMTRGGPRVESAWCNFTPYRAMHDVRFVGSNFRERERIKRKRARWVSRFKAMPPAERNCIAEALRDAEASIAAAGGEDLIAAGGGSRSTIRAHDREHRQ
jgi:DNA adenine methylase